MKQQFEACCVLTDDLIHVELEIKQVSPNALLLYVYSENRIDVGIPFNADTLAKLEDLVRFAHRQLEGINEVKYEN